jgi:integrase
MELRAGGRRESVRSYLTEILDLAHWTGRRISAVLGLRFENLHLERTSTAPDGAITWPAETDKKGRTWERIPVTAQARAALDRIMADRPGLGSRFLFPAPGDPTKPLQRRLATTWLHKAVKLAAQKARGAGGEFTVPKGWGWHAFRRQAATESKGAPDKDVMALYGWSDLRSLKDAYQHADAAGMLAAIQNRGQLREAR